jgi:membrane protease YdiL (CAAX protease family)
MKLSILQRLLLWLALTFPLSWYPWLIALWRGETSGPNPLGPFVAALIVTALSGGRLAVKDLLARIVRWRVGVQWYLFALFAPVLICICASALNILWGGAVKYPESFHALDLVEQFVFILLFIGLGEEPGWRGFGVENLQKIFSPLTTSLIIWVVWSVWHLPLFGSEFNPDILPAFFINVLAASIIQTWLYNRTNRSILLPMIFHAAVNTSGSSFTFQLFQGADQVRLWYINSFLWLVLAVGIAFVQHAAERKRLSSVTVPTS